MLFNSWAFGVFLPTVFLLYWKLAATSLRFRNLFLIGASYLFYGWWDYRFLSLIMISSAVDYSVGLGLAATEAPRKRKALLLASLLTNLGLLGFFKYFDFFIDSFAAILESLGFQPNLPSLRVVLPVGISFYTFQTLSYTIDVYRRRIPVTRDAVAFFAFVSFFPQLVAGPIERAASLLPQFQRRRTFDPGLAADGLRQMLWGFFKKMVIADNVARHVDMIFAGSADYGGQTLFFGVLLFAFQIYCDFSGYSDIAIGTARLFGFSLMRNFAYPYFSRNIAEFWRRWHISLSTWFRDYLYIPLGGSRMGAFRHHVNVIVTFTVSGLWHGANWTFVIWGLLNGLYFIPLMWTGRRKKHGAEIAPGRLVPRLTEIAAMALTFAATLIAWVFFRADSLSHATSYLGRMLFSNPFAGEQIARGAFVPGLTFITAMVAVEWLQRHRQHALEMPGVRRWIRWSIYLAVALSILTFGSFSQTNFIYFQF